MTTDTTTVISSATSAELRAATPADIVAAMDCDRDTGCFACPETGDSVYLEGVAFDGVAYDLGDEMGFTTAADLADALADHLVASVADFDALDYDIEAAGVRLRESRYEDMTRAEFDAILATIKAELSDLGRWAQLGAKHAEAIIAEYGAEGAPDEQEILEDAYQGDSGIEDASTEQRDAFIEGYRARWAELSEEDAA